MEEGTVPGGGVALLRARRVLAALDGGNDDQRHGIEIVRRAVAAPARQIAANSGADGAVVVGKILDNDKMSWGFDARTGEFGDLVQKGILDPKSCARRFRMPLRSRAC